MLNIPNMVSTALVMLLFSATLAAAEDNLAGSKVSALRMEQTLPAGKSGRGDEQLGLRQSDFERFAKAKVQEFNRNHRLSRSRMQISKQPDGQFRGVYHQIDGSSLACTVNRSQSRSIPYVGVLSYQEQIFEGFGATPEECRRGSFTPVAVIPNRHIFSYKNGSWN